MIEEKIISLKEFESLLNNPDARIEHNQLGWSLDCYTYVATFKIGDKFWQTVYRKNLHGHYVFDLRFKPNEFVLYEVLPFERVVIEYKQKENQE